jgi:predicted RNA-binding Zn ribbon-like protein
VDIVSYSDWAFELANSYWDPEHYRDPEQLPDLPALRTFLAAAPGWAEDVTEDDLVHLRKMRTRFRSLLEDALEPDRQDEAIRKINELLAEFPVRPKLSVHDDEPLHMHLSDCDQPVWQELTAAASLGLALRLADAGFDRLGTCQERKCSDIFLDTSSNACRRYCCDACANRANVAAHRARRKAAAAS